MARGKAAQDGPSPVDVHVGRRIATRRIECGYNQSDLGRSLRLTFQQIQKYEKGTNRVSASKLHATAQFLGVPVGYFFEGLGEAETVQEGYVPQTRYTVELARLAPALSITQQRLLLDMARSLQPAEAA